MNELDRRTQALTPEQMRDTTIAEHQVARPREMGDSDPDPSPDSDAYAEARKRTSDIIERMELEYDKALLILHPLGISVTSSLLVALWNKAATIPPLAYGFMFVAWLMWLAGIIATLASFRISVALHQRVLDFLLADKNPSGDESVKSRDRQNTLATRSSGAAFVLGVLLAAISLAIICTTSAKA